MPARTLIRMTSLPCSALLMLGLTAPPALARDEAAPAKDGAAKKSFYDTATVVGERPLESATVEIDVIKAELLEEIGARTLTDVMHLVPGLGTLGNGTRGGRNTATIRGGDSNFTLVLLDGVPVNDTTQRSGDSYNLEGLPLMAIDRVEIIRGPLSSYYGSTGLSGVINVITRNGEAGKTRVAASIEAGDASLRHLTATVSGGSQKLTWLFGASHEEEKKRVADESFKQQSVMLNLAASPSDTSHVRVSARFVDWEAADYPEVSGGPLFGDGELRFSDHRESSLSSEMLFGRQRRQRVSLAWYRHEQEIDTPQVFPIAPASIESIDFQRGRASWSFNAVDRKGMELNFGADATWEEGINDSTLFLPPIFGGFEIPGDYELSRTNPGVYGELILDRGNVVFEVAARVDRPDGQGSEFNPRLGVSYRPGGGATRLHATAGRAFKLPAFFGLASPPELAGNPDLLPEEMVGGDVGIDRSFASSGIHLGVTAFYNRYENLIGFDVERFLIVNLAEVEALGAELSFSWQIHQTLTVEVAATWLDIQNLKSDEPLTNRPKWSGGATLLWRPKPPWKLSLDVRSVSSYLDLLTPAAPTRVGVDGHTLADLAVSWKIRPSVELRGMLDNVTDEDYEVAIGFPGPPRSVRLLLGLNFHG